MDEKSREMPVVFLLLLVCVHVTADTVPVYQPSTRLTVNPNAMWIAAVAAGAGMMVLSISIFLVSTFLLRRYERKRVMLLAPMLARLQPPNDTVNDQPRQMTSAGPPAASSLKGEMARHDALSVTAAQPIGVGHVYYNRGLDIDEAESKTTKHLDPKPIQFGGTRPKTAEYEISVL